jgi:ATP synthase protein I
MAEHPEPGSRGSQDRLARRIASEEARKLRARGRRDRAIWFGLGVFGIVGWSVAIPTVLGIAAGIWIDAHWPGRFSWTLMLLLLGIGLGCVNAWYWVSRERQTIESEEADELEHD